MDKELKAALKAAAVYVYDDPATAMHRTAAAVAAFLRAPGVAGSVYMSGCELTARDIERLAGES
jgi:hypothetical protein